MGPYEAFLSGKPVITTSDAGGPLDVVHDRRTGLVVEPDAAAVRRRPRPGSASHDDEAAALGGPGRPSPTRSPGIARSRGCSREGRLLLADAA